MNRGRSILVLGFIVLLGGGIALLLSGGGGAVSSTEDPARDVVITKGPRAPLRIPLADLRAGSVRVGADETVFEATVGRDIPLSLKKEAATFRWEITENGRVTWIVSAAVDVERSASVVATQFDYRGSTIDQSLPGDLVVEGATVQVTLRTDGLQGFPRSFSWTLEAELDGDRTRSPSAVARDVLPDEGSLEVGSQ